MKKIIFIVFLSLIFYSCSIPYDMETRYIIETKLVDLNGNPVPNEKLEAYVDTESSGETISSSISDENGLIRMIFPKPDLNNFTFSISNSYNSINGFLSKGIYNIKQNNFIDYKLVLDEIKLVKFDEVTNLTIELNQTSQNKELRKIEIIGQDYNQNEYLSPIQTPENYYDLQTYFTLLKYQNFILKYSVYEYSTMVTEETIVNLSISDQPINYILTY